jgi:hypothetical protein
MNLFWFVRPSSIPAHTIQVVEHPLFIAWIMHLNPDAKLFGADALGNKIRAKFLILRDQAKAYLAKNKSKISLTTDLWTTDNSQIPFMAITGHLLTHNFDVKSFIIDFVHVPGSHTGERIYEYFTEALTSFGIEPKKVMALTMDNASSNDTFGECLLKNGWVESNEHLIRCLAHVLDLAARDALESFTLCIREMRANVKSMKYAPKKLNEYALALSLKRFRFEKVIIAYNERHKDDDDFDPIKFLMFILDVATRWNSTHAMCERFSYLRIPFEEFVFAHNRHCKKDDELYAMSEYDWKVLDEVLAFLRPFKEATMDTNGSLMTTISNQIPWYERLIKSLKERKVFSWLFLISLNYREFTISTFRKSKILIPLSMQETVFYQSRIYKVFRTLPKQQLRSLKSIMISEVK